MGLLDSVLGGLLGGGSSPLQSILASILTGSSGGNGLPGLVEKFNQAGLGQVVGSWIGSEPNQPVSPSALGQVFGHDQVNQWAQQTGMSHDGVLSELSKLLPHAVDQVTPQGEIPSSPFDAPGLELPARN